MWWLWLLRIARVGVCAPGFGWGAVMLDHAFKLLAGIEFFFLFRPQRKVFEIWRRGPAPPPQVILNLLSMEMSLSYSVYVVGEIFVPLVTY